MSLEALKKNIEEEKRIVEELDKLEDQSPVNPEERRMLDNTKANLISMLKIINKSIPNLVENISLVKKLPSIGRKVVEERPKGSVAKTIIIVF